MNKKLPIKIKPYKHQLDGFNRCMENDGYGLLFDVGLGKSLTAVAVATQRFMDIEVKRVLVVCPMSVVSVWEREFGYSNADVAVRVLDGTKWQRLDCLRHFPKESLQVAVINYEGIRLMVDEIIRWQADMLIVDESHKIKNIESLQSAAVLQIASAAKYRIILTATPISNSSVDLFTQWQVIDSNIFGTDFEAFKKKYFYLGMNKKLVESKRMLPELTAKMHSKAMRISKEQALDLPKQIFQKKYCVLEKTAMTQYNKLKSEAHLQIEKQEQTGTVDCDFLLPRMIRLQEIANGFVKIDGGGICKLSNAKIDLLSETLDDFITTEKIVIFARYTFDIIEISDLLRAKHIKHIILNGQTHDKGAAVKEFQTEGNNTAVIEINGREFARATFSDIKAEGRRRGDW